MSILHQTTEPRSAENALRSRFLDDCSDADLLEAWTRDQQAEALATLVKRYRVMVLSVCRRRCRSDADADDAFQSTFLYLARNSGKIRSPERLPGWLHRVAQRAAVATWKSLPGQTEPMVEPPADPDDPLDRLTQRHEAIVLDEELADLPEHYRSALVMHIYQGHPLQSLADHFGTTIGVIRGRLQRGKQLLGRRLRRRGVVPVLAFASAHSWSATEASAAASCDSFIASISGGALPQPPIDPKLHQSLLSQGAPLMPAIYTTTGLIGGTALLALLISMPTSTGGAPSGGNQTLTMAAVAPQFGGGGASIAVDDENTSSEQTSEASGTAAATTGGEQATMMGGMGGGGLPGGMGGVAPAYGPNTRWTTKPVVPTPTTATAQQAMAALDADLSLSFQGSLSEFTDALELELAVPVLIDQRGLEFAKLRPEATVQIDADHLPLRTSLRQVLRPLGLRAVVEDEGLVITADPSALVHQGVGTSRWINVDQTSAEKISEQLEETTSFDFNQIPLRDAVDAIAKQHSISIGIDRRALEEIGLSDDVPVRVSQNGVKLESVLTMMLTELDLTTTLKGESLMITEEEAAEAQLLSRIYWLEGTGVAGDDPQSIIDLIQTTVTPDTWEVLGGPSTLAPVKSTRPALLVRTTFQTHRSIEQLIDALRETHFGADPVSENVAVPATQPFGGFGGGMGGMGGGGMGGGGMGGGGGGGFF